jgi:hypothetical protein
MSQKEGYVRYRPTYVVYIICSGLALAFMLATCSKHSDEAAAYNDSIVSHQDLIIQSFDVLDSALTDSSSTEVILKSAHNNLLERIDNSVLALDSIGPFRKDPSLMKAARTLFISYNQMAETHYEKLCKIHQLPENMITQAIVDSTESIHNAIKRLSQDAQNAFLKEQEAFGKKYRLTFKE